MKRIRTLQEQLKTGKITKEEYAVEIKKLLDDDFIDQEEHDEAAAFNAEEDKPIFTQADVDRMVVTKATKMVRKALKDAGIEVDAANKDLLTAVATLAKAGQGTDGKATDQDLTKLKALETKVPGLEGKVKNLSMENAVLKGLGGNLKAINPIQVVRALKMDYMDLVEIDDETGEVDPKSVILALKQMATAEPNLFKAAEAEEEDDLGGETDTRFRGKPPGGGAGSAGSKEKNLEKKKEEARDMLRAQGILPPKEDK